MLKFYSAIVAMTLVLVPVTVSAETSEPVSFKHAGETYTYTVEQVGSTRVLRGEFGSSRAPFVLRVGKRTVTGTVNGNPVEFSRRSVSRVKGIVIIEQLANR